LKHKKKLTRGAIRCALLTAIVTIAAAGPQERLGQALEAGARPEVVSSVIAGAPTGGADPVLFVASYEPGAATGSVTAYRIDRGGVKPDSEGLWGRVTPAGAPSRPQSTATLMDAKGDDWPARRVLLSARTQDGATTGVAWRWASLSEASRLALQFTGTFLDAPNDGSPLAAPAALAAEPAEARGKARMAYLRGDLRLEASAAAPGPFRTRASRHGDIVHSRPWYLSARPSGGYTQEDHAGFRQRAGARPAMFYVGANDGMLHGFDAATGEERIAYVPEGLHPRLATLALPAFRHGYFVDGSPLAGDVYLGPPGSRDPSQWRSYLAGFPGRGGKGYFVLDVTDPREFAESRASRLVVLDHSADASDRDIGRILAEPVTEIGDPSASRQITRMNDGRWALVIGNGHGSTDQKAVLLVQYLDQGKELLKIEADARPGLGNGLSAPRLIDLDGNGTPDLAYAGDLRGQLWKFDLSGKSSTTWSVAFDGKPLFRARDPASGRPQPIASAPVWKAHPRGGLMLAFGTGQDGSAADRLDGQPQSVYGIHDDTPIGRRDDGGILFGKGSGPVEGGRARLVRQTAENDPRHGVGTVSSNAPRGVGGGTAPPRGWWLDLPLPRERVLRNPSWFDGDLVDIWSSVPSDDPAEPPAAAPRSWRTTLDIFNGSAPRSRLYLHVPAGASGQPSRVETTSSVAIRDPAREWSVAAPGMPAPPPVIRLGGIMMRPSWRQLE